MYLSSSIAVVNLTKKEKWNQGLWSCSWRALGWGNVTCQARERGAKAHFYCYLKIISSFVWSGRWKDIHSWTCLILEISECFSFEWLHTLVSSFHYMDLPLLSSDFVHLDFSNQARIVEAEWVSLGSLIGLSVYEAESK